MSFETEKREGGIEGDKGGGGRREKERQEESERQTDRLRHRQQNTTEKWMKLITNVSIL